MVFPRLLVVACLALAACSGSDETTAPDKTDSDGEGDGDSKPGGSGESGTEKTGGDNPAKSTPLSALEQTVASVLVGKKVSNRTQAYVFNADRTGCYFWLHESGVRQDNVNFENWSIDETKPTVDSNTSETLYPLVFDTQRGNHSDADRYNADTGDLWPSGQSNIRLTASTTTLSCVK